jgi:hypothetical protein
VEIVNSLVQKEKETPQEGFDVGFNKNHTGFVTAKGLSFKR